MAVAPVLVGVGSRAGQSPERSVERPAPTTTATKRGQHAVVACGLVNTRNGERDGQDPRVRDLDEPAPTATAGGSQGAIAVAHLVAHYGPGDGGQNRAASAEEPMRTATCEPRHSVVTAYLAQHNTDMVGHSAEDEPVSTIVGKGCTQAVVAASLISLKGTDRRDGSAEEPAPAQTAGGTHTGVVTAFMQRYFGTEQDPRLDEAVACQTTKDRSALIEVKSGIPPLTATEYARAKLVAKFLRKFGCWDGGEIVTTKDGSVLVDIGMRMLIPRELFRAQGFSDAYIIAYGITNDGRQIPLTKTTQIRLVGNSVCPQVAAALVGANYQPMAVTERGVPEFALRAAE
jgi:DNA (cytosine-5)-methyltransferase 1